MPDTFFAESGADTYNGGTRIPGAGEDVADAATYQLDRASDELVYSEAVAPQFVTLDGAANDGATGEADNAKRDIEAVIGGRADDQLTAGPHPVRIEGGAGDDRITGSDSDDFLYGRDGSDTLIAGAGNDRLDDGDFHAGRDRPRASRRRQ